MSYMTRPDRYNEVARSLRYVGWVQDALLHRARMRVVELVVGQGCTTVIDACCGAGTLTRSLAEAGLEALGVDQSPAMLALARRRAPRARFVCADVASLTPPRSVDAVVIALALHEMPEDTRQRVWTGLHRLIRPGGLVVIMDYTPPLRVSASTRVAGWVITQDERGMDAQDPGHYSNYLEFMALGGAVGWLRRCGIPLLTEDRFLYGHLAVVTTKLKEFLVVDRAAVARNLLTYGHPPPTPC